MPKEKKKSVQPSQLKLQGNEAFAQGNLSLALKQYTQALERCSEQDAVTRLQLLCNRSRVFLKLGRLDEAREEAIEAVTQDPNCAKAQFRFAEASYYRNDTEEALRALTTARQLGFDGDELFELQRNLSEQEATRYQTLRKFLTDNGGQVSRLKIKEQTTDFRYISAHCSIQQGDVLLQVPKHLLILLSEVKRHPLVSGLNAAEATVGSWTYLAVFLLVEKENPDSFWKPYLDVIPFSENFPVFYPQEHLEVLKKTTMYNRVRQFKEESELSYQRVMENLPDMSHVSLREFQLAYMAVASRCFGIKINGVDDTAMVAYADMLNHRNSPQTKWYFDDKRNAFVITAEEDIDEGKEVFDTYGKKPNDTLLMNYGFLLVDNPDDVIRLGFLLQKDDPLLGVKREIFEATPGDDVVNITISENVNLSDFRESICKLRLLLFEGEPTVLAEAAQNLKKKVSVPISTANEYSVYSWIAEAIKVVLDQLPPEAKEDVSNVLKSDSLPDEHPEKLPLSLRNCVLYRGTQLLTARRIGKMIRAIHPLFGLGKSQLAKTQSRTPELVRYDWCVQSILSSMNGTHDASVQKNTVSALTSRN